MTRQRIALYRICAATLASGCVLFAQAGFAADLDLDGVDDAVDNCAGLANGGQLDGDGDGSGDACDADYNNDGLVDGVDLELLQGSFNSEAGDGAYSSAFDHNGDGQIDGADFGQFQNLMSAAGA